MENKEIAKVIEDAINNTSCHPAEVALNLARMHRYLQNEFFKICCFYIIALATNRDESRFDARNEYACKKAAEICEKVHLF